MEEDTLEDALFEGRDEYDMDVDRMVNEGLGAGLVSMQNGLVTETTTDAMEADER